MSLLRLCPSLSRLSVLHSSVRPSSFHPRLHPPLTCTSIHHLYAFLFPTHSHVHLLPVPIPVVLSSTCLFSAHLRLHSLACQSSIYLHPHLPLICISASCLSASPSSIHSHAHLLFSCLSVLAYPAQSTLGSSASPSSAHKCLCPRDPLLVDSFVHLFSLIRLLSRSLQALITELEREQREPIYFWPGVDIFLNVFNIHKHTHTHAGSR